MAVQELIPNDNKTGLIAKIATRYGVDPNKLLDTLKMTAFKQRGNQPTEITNEQMMALLIVADQYRLNPFTKEIFAFPQDGGIVPIVGVDGWSRIINNHKAMDGLEFVDVGEVTPRGKSKQPCPDGIQCILHRKDREHPIKCTEWYEECYRDTRPWNDMPRRQLRHKAMIQTSRIGFSFVGIYDEEEGQRIIEGEFTVESTEATGGTAAAINEAVKNNPPAEAAKDTNDAEIVEPAIVGEEVFDAKSMRVLIDSSKHEESIDYARSLIGDNFKGKDRETLLDYLAKRWEEIEKE